MQAENTRSDFHAVPLGLQREKSRHLYKKCAGSYLAGDGRRREMEEGQDKHIKAYINLLSLIDLSHDIARYWRVWLWII
jgi:hypothetical protein